MKKHHLILLREGVIVPEWIPFPVVFVPLCRSKMFICGKQEKMDREQGKSNRCRKMKYIIFK